MTSTSLSNLPLAVRCEIQKGRVGNILKHPNIFLIHKHAFLVVHKGVDKSSMLALKNPNISKRECFRATAFIANMSAHTLGFIYRRHRKSSAPPPSPGKKKLSSDKYKLPNAVYITAIHLSNMEVSVPGNPHSRFLYALYSSACQRHLALRPRF